MMRPPNELVRKVQLRAYTRLSHFFDGKKGTRYCAGYSAIINAVSFLLSQATQSTAYMSIYSVGDSGRTLVVCCTSNNLSEEQSSFLLCWDWWI